MWISVNFIWMSYGLLGMSYGFRWISMNFLWIYVCFIRCLSIACEHRTNQYGAWASRLKTVWIHMAIEHDARNPWIPMMLDWWSLLIPIAPRWSSLSHDDVLETVFSVEDCLSSLRAHHLCQAWRAMNAPPLHTCCASGEMAWDLQCDRDNDQSSSW